MFQLREEFSCSLQRGSPQPPPAGNRGRWCERNRGTWKMTADLGCGDELHGNRVALRKGTGTDWRPFRFGDPVISAKHSCRRKSTRWLHLKRLFCLTVYATA